MSNSVASKEIKEVKGKLKKDIQELRNKANYDIWEIKAFDRLDKVLTKIKNKEASNERNN